MEPVVVGAITTSVLILGALGAQLMLHAARWREPPSRTEGDYREPPREIEGVVAIRWDVVAVAAVTSLWSVCTYLFAAAGALLVVMAHEDSASAVFVPILGAVVVSGVVHASMALRVASRLVRRHDRVARSATRNTIHGVIHHAAVLLLFGCWSWQASRHDFEEAMIFLVPICVFGAFLAGLVHFAGAHARRDERQLISAAII
ncbi:MAG: hypothetical protein J0L92_12720 [Deltaproteobacteria bacterium]|nr:hypothetical protein [Deltaproteobacteria bacterium]